jgi:AraC-like DNA-binding protein/ligand-binding sensor protein
MLAAGASGARIDAPFECPVCGITARSTGEPSRCADVHRYAGFQSLRFGGRYTYFCPGSLTYFSAPLLDDGAHVGTFVAGPVLLIPAGEYIAEEIDAHSQLSGEARASLVGQVRSIPHVSPERAHALSEILLYVASWAGGTNVRDTVEEQNRLSREASISGYIHHLKTMGGDSEVPTYPTETERRLLAHIREGERERARELLTELLARIRISSGSSVEQVKARVLELAVLLSRAALDGGADPESVFGLNYRALGQVHELDNVAALSDWLSRMAERFVTFVFDVRRFRHRDVIQKARQYIRTHYAQKLGLEDVATHVGLSPAYFSRLFKEETGNSFSGYLASVRVERSKELLRDGTLSLADIALETGFADQSHFSRVFKKETGVSPSRYRAQPADARGENDPFGYELEDRA